MKTWIVPITHWNTFQFENTYTTLIRLEAETEKEALDKAFKHHQLWGGDPTSVTTYIEVLALGFPKIQETGEFENYFTEIGRPNDLEEILNVRITL